MKFGSKLRISGRAIPSDRPARGSARVLRRMLLPLLISLAKVGGAQPYTTPPPAAFKAEVWASAPGFMAGVVTAANGDVLVRSPDCGGTATFLRFDPVNTTIVNSTTLHVFKGAIPIPPSTGCGVVQHGDGTLYTNTLAGVLQLSRTDPNIGALLSGPFGAGGDNLGITVDPYCSDIALDVPMGSCPKDKHRLVYIDGNGHDIRTVDPANPASDTLLATTPASAAISRMDGIAFGTDKSLYLASRSPTPGVVVITITDITQGARGVFDRLIPLTSEPDGIGSAECLPTVFPGGICPAANSGVIFTNNTNGTISVIALRTPTTPDAVSQFAAGGFRGDLMLAHSDGSFLFTQNGTRFNNGTVSSDNSVVRISRADGNGFSVSPNNAALVLGPLLGANVTGAAHTVTAKLQDTSILPAFTAQGISGLPITFKVLSGPNAGVTGVALTNGNGEAQFTYVGSNQGTDFIQASFKDASGVSRFSNDVKLPWSASACDTNGDGVVNTLDISDIVLARNQTAQPGDARDADHDGKITLADARICALKCSKPGCAQ